MVVTEDLKKIITLKALNHIPSNGQGSVCSSDSSDSFDSSDSSYHKTLASNKKPLFLQ